MHGISKSLTVVVAVVCALPVLRATAGNEPSRVDPAVVAEKINALGIRDDTIPYAQQPRIWLRGRREQATPQLIEGLASHERRIAVGCLKLLKDVPPSKVLVDALIAVASDRHGPANVEMTLALAPFADDVRARRLMEQAVSDVERFPSPVDRAVLANALGHKKMAVAILLPLLDESRSEHELSDVVRQLGVIAGPDAIGVLERMSHDRRWSLARRAYITLADVDPTGHALTNDQRVLLSIRKGKESQEAFDARCRRLAALNRKDIRPYVVQAVTSTEANLAFAILSAWRDRRDLPLVGERIVDDRGRLAREALGAYIEIDDGKSMSQAKVLELLAKRSGPRLAMGAASTMPQVTNWRRRDECLRILRVVCEADVPADRKLAILRAARKQLGSAGPSLISHSLDAVHGDKYDILQPLMADETDLKALGGYAKIAAQDKNLRYSGEVRRAMRLLAESDRPASEAAKILNAVAVYQLKDMDGELARVMQGRNPALGLQAAATAARMGVLAGQGEALMLDRFTGEDGSLRAAAAKAMVLAPTANEAARRRREEAALAMLGTAAEGSALRVLATCGRGKTFAVLGKIIDEPDVPRALFAAWVLAQLPGQEPASKGMRRLAIYAFFKRQTPQMGGYQDISFRIAPGLYFGQRIHTFGRFGEGGVATVSSSGPVILPAKMLRPFPLDDAEQRFIVRAYRFIEASCEGPSLPCSFLDAYGRRGLDETFLPLLEVIAREDTNIICLYIKGRKVPFFQQRKYAAERTAAITGNKASYLGLAGESLDSGEFPQPYDDRNVLLARYIVDRMAAAGLTDQSSLAPQSRDARHWRQSLYHLREQFGHEALNAIWAEANKRGLMPSWRASGLPLPKDN